MESFPGEGEDTKKNSNEICHSSKNNQAYNLKNNLKNNDNNSSLSPSPRNKLRSRKKDFNSIQPNSNLSKKNSLNTDLKQSGNNNNR